MSEDTEKQGELILCERCNKMFICSSDRVDSCQCHSVSLHPSTLKFLDHTEWDCLCADCLQDIDIKVMNTQGKEFPKSDELKEDIHFYMEDGLLVFTENYHILRGHCCKSGCRHCAYGFKNQ